MPSLAKQFTKQQIEHALEHIMENDVKLQPSTVHDLVYKGQKFPPKEVVRWAAKLSGFNDDGYSLSGGTNTNDPLLALGFTIAEKNQALFSSLIQEYKGILRSRGLEAEIYKWRLVKQHKGRPDIAAPDFRAEIWGIEFSNLIYGVGKGAIRHLSEARPEEYRACFEALYDEAVPFEDRVEQFNTDVTAIYRTLVPELNRSAHNDERTIATFMTYHDPERYTFYKDSFYQILCKRLGVPARPKNRKYPHYLDIVADFIDGYISKDTELTNLIASLKDERCYEDPNFNILAQDILYTVLEKQNMTFETLAGHISAMAGGEEAKGLKMLTKKIESDKWNKWIKLGDDKNIIKGPVAHYEIGQNKKTKEIGIGLHFEDKKNNKKFREIMGDALPVGLYWGEWYDAHSVLCERTFSLTDENLVSDVLDQILCIEEHLGDKVRELISSNFNSKIFRSKYPTNTMQQPKNQILYGPPGTGKTFNTINRALQIIDDDEVKALDWDDRKKVKELYDKKVSAGQIVFTTFHQSLSYEDFVEGIKPQAPAAEGGNISYEVEPGIFRQICDTARTPIHLSAQGHGSFDKSKFFKMSIGGKHRPDIHDWCLDNNVIGLGYGNDEDFTELNKIKDWDKYRDAFREKFPKLVSESRYHIQAMFIFQRMKIGDIVVITKGNHVIDAIGKVTGDYYFDDSTASEYSQFRKVEWLAKNINQSPSLFFNKNISQQTIYEFFDDDVKKEAFNNFFVSSSKTDKNYVLIIDEINRGNVSAVFGELITLIEDSKRIGASEALEVTLPYSKTPFGVPSNVYIIGTMNTADRSVEAIDTALRRRFAFSEMPPQPDHDLIGSVEGVDLKVLLKKINGRLEKLLSRDHAIGHTYFMDISTAKELYGAFYNKIIPLLQEYFFGDYGKIGLVLGVGFVVPDDGAGGEAVAFAKFAYDDQDLLLQRKTYRIRDYDKNFEGFMAAVEVI